MNGVATDALVDTKSPSTIISLEFLLEVMVKTRPDSQMREQWKEDTFTRFSDPDVTLKSYMGHQLDLIAQTPVHLSQGAYSVDTVVLVQKGTPNDLLGTDLQSQLGLLPTMEKATGQHVNLHNGIAYAVKPARSAVKTLIQSTRTVREQHGGEVNLIIGVKIPLRHLKLVRAWVTVDNGDRVILFTQRKQVLVIADSAVEVGESG